MRHFLFATFVLGLACSLADALAAADPPRPNIIFIMSDDQGYADLGRHGNPILKTPNLDKLYDQSVRFTDFVVSPTCSPTRTSLMTGRHEFRSGVTHTIHERERMSLKATTYVQLLREAGYTTGIFGKWHLGDEDAYLPEKRGFEKVFIHGCGGIGQSYPGSCGDSPKNSYFHPTVWHRAPGGEGKFEATQGYCTDVFFAAAQKWIESQKGDQPFYACITPNAPHGPLNVPPEYEAKYADKVQDKQAAKFFGMIENIDDNVGRLIELLDRKGLSKNTLVIYMNDNGGTAGVKVYNAGMRGSKVQPWWGGTRAMSLWRWPGRLGPSDVKVLCSATDLFPTLCELAGAKVAADVSAKLEGRNLVPLLHNLQTKWDERYLFTHVGRWQPGTPPEKYGGCSVRFNKFQLVREGKKWSLYDIASDPAEKNDLSAAKPELAAQLEKAYDAWWESVQPDLSNEDAYKTAPKMNPWHVKYWKQFGGPGPNHAPVPAGLDLK